MFFKRADCLMIGKYNKPPRKQETISNVKILGKYTMDWQIIYDSLNLIGKESCAQIFWVKYLVLLRKVLKECGPR